MRNERTTSSDDRRIPRRIIHFWNDLEAMPEGARRAIAHTRDLHPGYEHVLADDAFMIDFIGEHHGPRELELYTRNCIPASRCDIARLMLLLRYGGIYIDAPWQLHDSLDALILPEKELLLVRSPRGQQGTNTILASTPGHPFIEHVLQQALGNLEHRRFNLNVSRATGPDCLVTTLRQHGEPPNTQWASIADVATKLERASSEGNSPCGSWRWQQSHGIIRQRDEDPDPLLLAQADGEHRGALFDAEAEYLSSADPFMFRMNSMPEFIAHSVNEAWLGNPNTAWDDVLASRGPFRHVALLSYGSAPSAEFFIATGAESVTVYSPHPDLCMQLKEELASANPAIRFQYVLSRADQLKLPENTFDLVLSQFFLQRAFDLEETLDLIVRSLRPGGRLAFLEYVGEDRYQFSKRRLALAQKLIDAIEAASGLEPGPGVVAPPLGFRGPLAAVHSSRIIPAVRERFYEEERASYLVASLPLMMMMHPRLNAVFNGMAISGLSAGLSVLFDTERALLEAGEEGTVAFGTYAPRSTEKSAS